MSRPSGYTQPKGWATTRARILKRDGHTCYVCNGEATTVDHIVPVSQHQDHTDENLAAICGPCHTIKSEAERRAGWAKRKPRSSTKRKPETHPGAIT